MRNVKNLVSIFDNSLKERASNLLNSEKRTQQNSPLYTASFISNFHCRYELNKAEHNKKPRIDLKTLTILKDLFRKGIRPKKLIA